MQLIAGYRLIRARSDPGFDGLTQTPLLELTQDSLHAAVFLNKAVDYGRHLAADQASEQTIK